MPSHCIWYFLRVSDFWISMQCRWCWSVWSNKTLATIPLSDSRQNWLGNRNHITAGLETEAVRDVGNPDSPLCGFFSTLIRYQVSNREQKMGKVGGRKRKKEGRFHNSNISLLVFVNLVLRESILHSLLLEISGIYSPRERALTYLHSFPSIIFYPVFNEIMKINKTFSQGYFSQRMFLWLEEF